MLAQSIATAIAGMFANAAAGANAALLYKRSIRTHAARPIQRTPRVQLRVAGSQTEPSVRQQLDARYSDNDFIARQISSHREAVALYQRNANGADAQLRGFAREILPQLQEHLAMLESIQSESHRARR